MTQADADALQRRLVSFAVKIIELVCYLPKTSCRAEYATLGAILGRNGSHPGFIYIL